MEGWKQIERAEKVAFEKIFVKYSGHVDVNAYISWLRRRLQNSYEDTLVGYQHSSVELQIMIDFRKTGQFDNPGCLSFQSITPLIWRPMGRNKNEIKDLWSRMIDLMRISLNKLITNIGSEIEIVKQPQNMTQYSPQVVVPSNFEQSRLAFAALVARPNPDPQNVIPSSNTPPEDNRDKRSKLITEYTPPKIDDKMKIMCYLYGDHPVDKRLSTWIHVTNIERGKQLYRTLITSDRAKFFGIERDGLFTAHVTRNGLRGGWKGDTTMISLMDVQVIDDPIYAQIECCYDEIIGIPINEGIVCHQYNLIIMSTSLPDEAKTQFIKWKVMTIG